MEGVFLNIMSLTSIQIVERQANMSHVVRKPVFGVSDQFRHKPGCTTIDDGLRLAILDLGSKAIVQSMQ